MTDEPERSDDVPARRRRSHRTGKYFWCTTAIAFVLIAVVALLIGSDLPDGSLEHAVLIGLICAASFFVADWICAILFKRKTRPWHMHEHPDDQKLYD